MLLANFKPKTTAAALRGILATAQLSCFLYFSANMMHVCVCLQNLNG